MVDQISIRGARLHNLKNIDVDIPKNQLIVLTGLSGSGKSTLGFDILMKEGARQYLESLGFATMGLSKPPVDAIKGLSPTISVDTHLANHSPRSTVGTSTEVFTYVRVLFARLGRRPCPSCGQEAPPPFDAFVEDDEGEASFDFAQDVSFDSSFGSAQDAAQDVSFGSAQDAGSSALSEVEAPPSFDYAQDADEAQDAGSFACPHCGAAIPEMGMANFSFNKPAGACPTCTGLGTVHQANLSRLVDEELSITAGAVRHWEPSYARYYGTVLVQSGKYYGMDFDLEKPLKDLPAAQRDLLFYGVNGPQFRRHFPQVEPPDTVSKGRFEGIANNLLRRYAEHIQEPAYREKMSEFLTIQTCPDCQGTRLRPESRAVTVDGRGIVPVSRLALSELGEWLEALPSRLSAEEMIIAAPVLGDLNERVRRLVDVGVGYLNMERASTSISAGEALRLRLASLLGSGLTGVLYVLDEPTIGLHQRDTLRLIEFLRRLRDLGNTVLVIEHDLEVIRAADWVIDIGPGAGKAGGRVAASGTPQEVARTPGSITGDFLAGRRSVALPEQRRAPNGKRLSIYGARQNNLKGIDVHIPLGLLVAVSGVSGSGKSSLVFDILDTAARQRFYGAAETPGLHERIEGWEQIDKVITIDQTPIGRMPRSNAATYSDAFTPIREAFAATPEARSRKMTARNFSFNVPGGRCERCEGAGVLTVKMHFLPDVEVRCPACRGRRFNRQTLSVQYRGQNIAQVLEMTVEEALELFADLPPVASRLKVMVDVGLGYLQLGQPATTLSGGEAQRVKLAKELGRRSSGRTLYLLDEPTTGLHPADTDRLLGVLQRLVEAGHSVLVVEHNLDVIRAADWVIDLGPEGGEAGGELLAAGTPEQVAQVEGSFTGQFLRRVLEGSESANHR